MINKMDQKIEKTYMWLLIILFSVQPILELTWFNDGTIGEIAGFTIPTLVRFGLMGIITVMSIFVIRFNHRHIWMAAYLVLVAFYFVLHHIFSLDFRSYVPGDFGYNFIQEAFYLCRMVLPVILIFFVYHFRINATLFSRIVVWLSAFSSGLVIITNVFKVAIGSYSNETILGNVFDWFFNKGQFTFNDLSSKGFFYWSIFSTMLVLIYPYLMYLYFKTERKRYFLLVVAQGLALYMFGTKATTFSVIIELVIMMAVYLFCVFVKKEQKFRLKAAVSFIVVLLIAFLVYPYTPAISRQNFDAEYGKDLDEEYEKTKEEELVKKEKDLEAYFDENYPYFSIEEEFMLNSYNYKYDLEFWDDLLNELGPSQRMQNRIIEERMLQRVKEINNDVMDTYFGMGYSRTSNIYNLERDFLYQYYSMGVVGVILLLGPYVGIVAFIMVMMLIRFKTTFNMINCSLILGCGLSLFLAYYSGNVMESLGITIIFALVLGYLLKINKRRGNEKDEEKTA